MRCCRCHSNPYLRSLTTTPRFEFSTRMGGASYWPAGHQIVMSHRSVKDWIVIHEMSHAAVHVGAAHGPEFALSYLDLIEGILGFDARQTLRGQFAKHKVRSWGKSKPRKASPPRQTKMGRVKAWAAEKGYEVQETGHRGWYHIKRLSKSKFKPDVSLDEVYGLADVVVIIQCDMAYNMGPYEEARRTDCT